MLTYLELKNFKSFSDIKFDLRKAYGEPKKIAFIYGENGSLWKIQPDIIILFLLQTLNTLVNQIKLKEPGFMNSVESIKDDKIRKQVLQHMLHM